MRHLFYGDYIGSPGTLLTFFEVPRIGSLRRTRLFRQNDPRHTNRHKFLLGKRLNDFAISFQKDGQTLTLQDPDTMGIILTEIPATNSNPTIHTDIPAEKQIVRIIGADYHVPDPAATSQFSRIFWLRKSEWGISR